MAKEAIEEIKRAEEAAKLIIGEAEEKAAQILKEAANSAAQSEQALKDAQKQEYDRAVSAAAECADKISYTSEQKAREKAEAERKRIFERKEIAAAKVKEAILQP